MSEQNQNWFEVKVIEVTKTEIAPRNCNICGCNIPLERLEALPGTQTCVNHSTEPKLIGYMSVSHKTGSEFITVDPRDREALRRAQRVHRRAR